MADNKLSEKTQDLINQEINAEGQSAEESEYSLNDDRRVRTLSPTALVVKRFLRNRVAVTGLVILAFMFVFSFIGGMVTPYREDQLFYRYDDQNKQFASVIENTELRYVPNGEDFPAVARAKFVLALKGDGNSFEASGNSYTYEEIGPDLYAIYAEGGTEPLALATYDIVSSASSNERLPFEFQRAILVAATNGEASFEYDGTTYTIDEAGAVLDGTTEVAYASRYVVQPIMSDVFLSQQFKEELIEVLDADGKEFAFTDDEGNTAEYTISYDATTKSWSVLQSTSTKVFDTYSAPS